MIRSDEFTGTVSASTPLSTQIRFVFDIIWKFNRNSFGVNAIINSNKICICYNMKVLNFHIISNTNLIWVDNGVDAETVPVNSSLLIINKDAFLLRCKLGKTIISITTVYHYTPPNYSSHQTFIKIKMLQLNKITRASKMHYPKRESELWTILV